MFAMIIIYLISYCIQTSVTIMTAYCPINCILSVVSYAMHTVRTCTIFCIKVIKTDWLCLASLVITGSVGLCVYLKLSSLTHCFCNLHQLNQWFSKWGLGTPGPSKGHNCVQMKPNGPLWFHVYRLHTWDPWN